MFLKLLFIAGLFGLSACQGDRNDTPSQLVAAAIPASGFMRADGSEALSFPEDHGPHPEYQTEWWYYTGNLETEAGRHFGYQLTFFRRALLPSVDRLPRESAWAAEQVYMAHFALTDVDGLEFTSFERFARGSANLAGAVAEPFAVWLEDWKVEEIETGIYSLLASQDGLGLELTLHDVKGPILQGDQGYSQKGPEPGNASYYYSLTRLASSGTVRVDEESFQVIGESWMDHEYSTSALSEGQIGWDWFSIQLDDGSELMVFQIRREDGGIDAFSSGSWIAVDGSVTKLALDDFQIETEDTWRSPHSGGPGGRSPDDGNDSAVGESEPRGPLGRLGRLVSDDGDGNRHHQGGGRGPHHRGLRHEERQGNPEGHRHLVRKRTTTRGFEVETVR